MKIFLQEVSLRGEGWRWLGGGLRNLVGRGFSKASKVEELGPGADGADGTLRVVANLDIQTCAKRGHGGSAFAAHFGIISFGHWRRPYLLCRHRLLLLGKNLLGQL